MKNLITYILLLSIAFSFTACAAANPAGIDVEALEQHCRAAFAINCFNYIEFYRFCQAVCKSFPIWEHKVEEKGSGKGLFKNIACKKENIF